jgi:hypothetical protein
LKIRNLFKGSGPGWMKVQWQVRRLVIIQVGRRIDRRFLMSKLKRLPCGLAPPYAALSKDRRCF